MAVAVMATVALLPSPAPATPVVAAPVPQVVGRIQATGTDYAYDVPTITIEAPKRHGAIAVTHRYAPAPRADLGAVYAAGVSVVGVPYVAGGKTPAGFDCSGFVSWAYGQAGVSLPGTVGGIRARGTVISAADARPGDILYWSGHVAIYAGPGLRLDANRPGSVVAVRAIYGNPRYVRIG